MRDATFFSFFVRQRSIDKLFQDETWQQVGYAKDTSREILFEALRSFVDLYRRNEIPHEHPSLDIYFEIIAPLQFFASSNNQ
jgi:hypothetical protein